MNPEKQSKLPEYVGKKIVEALKQDENEVKIFNDNNETINYAQPTRSNVDATFEPKIDLTGVFPQQETQDSQMEIPGIELPDNVMMLVKLINQLPAGVNRQVGAQIIRQTIEAMGISMKSVLSEAQYIQEDLGNATQDCANTIEEYKNNIKILEQKITTYKRQAAKLGELINLFVLTIK